MASQELIDELVGNAHGNMQRVREILTEHPELVDATAQWGETPVQAAAQMGDRAMTEYLLALGAPLDICAAAMLGRADAVKSMLSSDPDLARATGAHGIPVLYFPMLHGELAIAEVLLAAGADIDGGAGMMTPLHGAIMAGQPGMVRWLLDHKARTDLVNYDGQTPLDMAVANGQEAIAAILQEV